MARHTPESNSSSISSSFCLMEKQHCRAWHVSFVSICVCLYSATTEKCKAQISFTSMVFQENSRSKMRKKNKLFLVWFFALVCFFLELEIYRGDCTIRGRPGRLSCAKLSLPELLEKTTWHLHIGLALGWPKAPGAAGLSSDVGSLPQQCLCPAAWPEEG